MLYLQSFNRSSIPALKYKPVKTTMNLILFLHACLCNLPWNATVCSFGSVNLHNALVEILEDFSCVKKTTSLQELAYNYV